MQRATDLYDNGVSVRVWTIERASNPFDKVEWNATHFPTGFFFGVQDLFFTEFAKHLIGRVGLDDSETMMAVSDVIGDAPEALLEEMSGRGRNKSISTVELLANRGCSKAYLQEKSAQSFHIAVGTGKRNRCFDWH